MKAAQMCSVRVESDKSSIVDQDPFFNNEIWHIESQVDSSGMKYVVMQILRMSCHEKVEIPVHDNAKM